MPSSKQYDRPLLGEVVWLVVILEVGDVEIVVVLLDVIEEVNVVEAVEVIEVVDVEVMVVTWQFLNSPAATCLMTSLKI